MSGTQSPANRYQEIAIKTANPLQLVVLLYDAAICSAREARECVGQGNIAGRSKSINRCIAIISELQACLNLKAGGDIAASLNRLYDYMKRRLFSANVEQSIQPLAEVELLLDNIRTAWNELAAPNRGMRNPPGAQRPRESLATGTSPPAVVQAESVNLSA